ncbi:Cys-tRNA(Pro) deacylase [uncultured Corynebacterium sp.]|uniref:Cys-tRNA(Pro) deacylase n=1 Tax=uncultured Corynebacterium sp. TaxID=159447 RepID=UPI0025936E3E|nr:Cys-tRNA(Pro) deacylase [uncultured Corynebacterium sp.]
MTKKIHKTNAMRQLDRAKVEYSMTIYETDGGIDALHVAESLGEAPERIFKTLVLESSDKQHFVAVIGADHELDLKKVAAHFGVKNVKLFDWRQLKELTGYVRGGCSPVGMKRALPTVIDASAAEMPEMYVSAGEIGTQIVLAPQDLAAVADAEFADVQHAVL